MKMSNVESESFNILWKMTIVWKSKEPAGETIAVDQKVVIKVNHSLLFTLKILQTQNILIKNKDINKEFLFTFYTTFLKN